MADEQTTEIAPPTCQACSASAQPEHTPCCSSHGKPLCCAHYCRYHFVEVNRCSAQTHEVLERQTVGLLTIPAAARLRPGDLIRVTGPNSWELADERDYPPAQADAGGRDE